MSRLISEMLETANDLKLEAVTIKEIEILNLKEVKQLSPEQIKKMRAKEKLSQAVLAKILNITSSTYQKWERGEVTPKGANLKLLRLAYEHGVEYLIH